MLASKQNDWKLDAVRKRVVENLAKVLGKAATDNDSNDTQTLAESIETAMFTALAVKGTNGKYSCGEEYKEKFRSLHFNLKDKRNAERVLNGELTPEQIITMSSDEFADEDLKRMKEQVQEQSIRKFEYSFYLQLQFL